MPIPDYQTIMLPLLKIVAENNYLDMNKAVELIANEFELAEKERQELLPSQKQSIIYNRVGWARTYLKKAGLLFLPQRVFIEIADLGKKVLAENPKVIDKQFLRQFPEFLYFLKTSHQESETINTSNIEINQGTPEEVLEEAYSQLKNQVLVEIIEKIKSCSPLFFQNLIVDHYFKNGLWGIS